MHTFVRVISHRIDYIINLSLGDNCLAEQAEDDTKHVIVSRGNSSSL